MGGERFDVQPSELPDGEPDGLLKANDELLCARNAAIDLLADIEDILLHQNPSIAAEWQVVVGVWENRLLEAQIAARRAKRKCNLLQACVNADERIDTEKVQQIERQLDREFEEWAEKLEVATTAYQQAVAAHMATVLLTEEAADELKAAFRTLAKRLHPDLHPGLGESARSMFELAQLAYRKGDIKILKSLEVSTRGLEKASEPCATLIEAEAELALVEAQIRELEERRDKIKSERPYCLLPLLLDKAWVDAHIAQIKNEISACEGAERDYRVRCMKLGA